MAQDRIDYQFIGVLQHDIRWWHTAGPPIAELPEDYSNFISELIEQGYNCGELEILPAPNGRLTTAYWEIVDWKSIAFDLYSYKNVEEYVKACKTFEENWNVDE